MALRFRKSVKLAPGLRMNLSGSGASWTLGPRGASVGIGKRGTFLNTGIPGTGLYARQSLTSSSESRPTSNTTAVPAEKANIKLTVAVEEDGTINFTDAAGNPVAADLIDQAKRQKGDAIKAMIQDACDTINERVAAVAELHLDTPDPRTRIKLEPIPFDTPQPVAPQPGQLGFFAKMVPSKVRTMEAANNRAKEKNAHEAAERARLTLFTTSQQGNPEAMEEFFTKVLEDIEWPRETQVSFEVLHGGTGLAFDVDLPEVEDMPNKTATVPQRGYKMTVKELGPVKVQKLYAQHVHSIAFRLLGEAFAMLPTVQRVVLSGYSQRPDPATGHDKDDYLLSVGVTRDQWEKINFEQLGAVDVVGALDQFELRRNMLKTGAFKAIEPLNQ
jgi:hypothetical protein